MEFTGYFEKNLTTRRSGGVRGFQTCLVLEFESKNGLFLLIFAKETEEYFPFDVFSAEKLLPTFYAISQEMVTSSCFYMFLKFLVRKELSASLKGLCLKFFISCHFFVKYPFFERYIFFEI